MTLLFVWKPVKIKGKIDCYKQQHLNSVLVDKKSGYKVIYKCDNCNKISHTEKEDVVDCVMMKIDIICLFITNQNIVYINKE